MLAGNKIYLALIVIVASLGGLLFGFDIAVISGVLPFIEQQFQLTAVEKGWFVSSALIGCIAGVACSGYLSDRFGRKKLLFVAALLFLLSAIGCALFPSFASVVAARLTGGIGIGVASVLVPLYISEISPAAVRGRLVTCYQLAITVGILMAYITNAMVLKKAQQAGVPAAFELADLLFRREAWRGMFSIGFLPSLLFLIGLFFVPESPRWLIRKGRAAEGMHILQKIEGDAAAAIIADQTSGGQTKGSYRELFSPLLRRALLLGILLPLFSQLSGINAILYYGPSILNDAGIAMENSFLGQISFGLANLVFTFIAIWQVDNWGRRPLYLAGTFGAALSLFITGYFFYTEQTTGILLTASVIIFLACFACSIGPLKFVVAAEIFPTQVRAAAMGLSIMVMWVADALVAQLTPVLLNSLGAAGTFWLFGSFCVIAFIVVYKLLPETKGKTLEEMEGYWKGH
jgi:SP family arabinose:H+ symporter-like MFS transporter